jgi:hypothetical protein
VGVTCGLWRNSCPEVECVLVLDCQWTAPSEKRATSAFKKIGSFMWKRWKTDLFCEISSKKEAQRRK